MKLSRLRIATRQSPLALWQAEYVKQIILSMHPELIIELIPIVTIADKMLTLPLTKIGGKGLFVKELEKALLTNEADIAVHSVKDLPPHLPDGLTLAVICRRDDPRDVFVSNLFTKFSLLPEGSCIGTSSLRRQAQLKAVRPDLNFQNLRGNIGTRLQKLDDHEFDAIILAAAGLKRLELYKRIRHYLDLDFLLPAAGQAAIGIECRNNDHAIFEIISPLEHLETRACITAERVMIEQLGGNCQTPIGAYAQFANHKFLLRGLVSSEDGSKILRASMEGTLGDPQALGKAVANSLIAQGAYAILQSIS
jgi:hydroxymethylbilane synthase